MASLLPQYLGSKVEATAATNLPGAGLCKITVFLLHRGSFALKSFVKLLCLQHQLVRLD